MYLLPVKQNKRNSLKQRLGMTEYHVKTTADGHYTALV